MFWKVQIHKINDVAQIILCDVQSNEVSVKNYGVYNYNRSNAF